MNLPPHQGHELGHEDPYRAALYPGSPRAHLGLTQGSELTQGSPRAVDQVASGRAESSRAAGRSREPDKGLSNAQMDREITDPYRFKARGGGSGAERRGE